jgi:hypothetical protein
LGNDGLTLSEAEVVFGVHHFNWLQTASYPGYMELYQLAGNQILPNPILDPVTSVSNLRELALYSEYANGTEDDVNDATKYERFGADEVDSLPYYWNEGPGTLNEIGEKSIGALSFFDMPRLPADFYEPGADHYLEFHTQLVGVLSEGSSSYNTIAGGDFHWKSNATYVRGQGNGDPTAGGVVLYASDDLEAPMPTAGGVFDIIGPDGPIQDNAAPVADTTTVTTPEDSSVDIDLRSLVSDEETSDDELIFSVTGATHGIVTLVDGNTARFTPAANYNGPALFTYSVTDTGDGASPAITVGPITINVNVTPVVDPGSLSISSPTVNEAAGTMTFVVTLSGTVDGQFTVDYSSVAGSAGSGDYTATSGALSFAGTNGETRNVTVSIANDALVELSESFQLSLSNVQGTSIPVSVSTASGTGTITDNDSASIAIANNAAFENSGSLTFTVTLTGSVDAPFTVNYATGNIAGQAVAGNDYTATSGVLTFAGTVGETRTFAVSLSPDTLYENDEAFQVTLSNLQAGGRNVSISSAAATGTITNEDAAPTVTLTASPTTISENGGVSTITATLSQPSALPTVVNLGFTGTASSGDYNKSASAITIAAGQLTGTATITGVADPLSESSETVIVDVTSVSGATEATPQQATVTLTNFTTVGSNLQVTSTMASSVVAGSGTGNLVYTVTIKNAGNLNLTGLLLTQSGILPPGVTVKSIKASTGSFSGSPREWYVERFQPQEKQVRKADDHADRGCWNGLGHERRLTDHLRHFGQSRPDRHIGRLNDKVGQRGYTGRCVCQQKRAEQRDCRC